MIGIYLITNLVNNKIYIGQSADIRRRWLEHLRAGQPDIYKSKSIRDRNTPIHKAMQKYGIENFTLKVLEECSKEELNIKEIFWINKYLSNNKEYGYNLTSGGQDNFALKGEQHSQAKLTNNEVNQIKNLLKYSNKNLNEILLLFPQISKSTLSMINQGKTWHDSNEEYPLRKMSTSNKGSANGRAKFTEEQVMEIRTKYSQGISFKELCKEYGHMASYSTIKALVYGESYKHLPIWKNSEKRWIEPCIDYPQSLK